MNISLEKSEDLQGTITLLLSPEDYKKEVNEELKRQARKASLPGFRPGKVPVSVVRRMVGLSVLIEKVNGIIGEELPKYISEQELNLLGDPLPKDQKSEDYFDVLCNKELEFSFDVGFAPEFELNLDIPELPSQYQIEIDDEYIEKELEKLKDRFGESSNPEEIAKGDTIFGRLTEVDEDGENTEVGFEKMISLGPMRIKKEEIFEPFFGKKLDDTLDLDIFSLADTAEEIAQLLFMEVGEVEDLREKKFSFTIKRITRVTMAEMNPTFFNKVLQIPEGDEQWVEDEQEFLKQFREILEEDFGDSPKFRFQRDLRDKILEINPLELPDPFLKRWLKAVNEKMSDEDIEQQYEGFSKNTQWSLIKEKLAKEHEDLKVETEELEASILDSLKQNMPYMDATQEAQFMEHAIQNREIVNNHFTRLSEDKVFEFLSKEMTPDLEVITATDFINMLEAEAEEAKKKREAEEQAAAEAAEQATVETEEEVQPEAETPSEAQ